METPNGGLSLGKPFIHHLWKQPFMETPISMNSSCFSTSSPVPLGTLTPLASRRRQIWVTCARNPGDSSWIKWWISDQNSMNDHHDFTSMIIMILHQWSSWFYINDHHDFTSWHYNGILSSSSFFIMTLQWHQKKCHDVNTYLYYHEHRIPSKWPVEWELW